MYTVQEYTWLLNGTNYYVYHMLMLPSSASSARSTAAHNSLAIITHDRATAVYFEGPVTWTGSSRRPGAARRSSRPSFGIRLSDNSAWWSFHAGSNSSDTQANDALNMINSISTQMNTTTVISWAVLGDFNRDMLNPRSGFHNLTTGASTLPAGVRVINPGLSYTRPNRYGSGTQLDYMITNDQTAGLQAGVVGRMTDHLAVQFGTVLRAAAEVGPIKSHDHPGRCLDVVMPSGGSVVNDTQLQWAVCASNSDTQDWSINSDGSVSNSGYCLDDYQSLTSDGSQVELWQCLGGPNQTWVALPGDQLKNPVSGSAWTPPRPSARRPRPPAWAAPE